MSKDKSVKEGESYLVLVEAAEMFLLLWIDGKATFRHFDAFLRKIWLECCGHMSSFTDPTVKSRNSLFADEVPGEIAMKN